MGKWVWWWGHLKEPRTSVTSTEIISVIKPKSLVLSRDMRHKNQMKGYVHAGDQGRFTRRVRFILDQKRPIAWWGWRWSMACTFLMRGHGLGIHTVLMDHRPPVEWSHYGPGCHTGLMTSAAFQPTEAQTFLWLGFTKQNSYKQDPDSPTIPAPPKQNETVRRPKHNPDVSKRGSLLTPNNGRLPTNPQSQRKYVDDMHAIFSGAATVTEGCLSFANVSRNLMGALRVVPGSAEHGVTQLLVENVQAVFHSRPFAPDQLGLPREAAIWNLDFGGSRGCEKYCYTGGLPVRVLSANTWF